MAVRSELAADGTDLGTGNTNAAVVMIAEKCVDLLLGRAAPKPLQLSYARSA